MQISFDRLFAKNLQFFFAKLVQFVSLCQRLSNKLNFIKIWQVEVGQNKDLVCYRQKKSFRQCAWGLRQLVLKPGFRPKGRALGMLEKSENFNSLRPILFELCKKNYRGGSNWPPPPAGIGLTFIGKPHLYLYFLCGNSYSFKLLLSCSNCPAIQYYNIIN